MRISPRTWIIGFFIGVLALFLCLSAAAYLVDPFFQFRVKDRVYVLNMWFVGGGLIENYDYDTLIIGSSMTQNFNMDVFRERLGVEPLHVGLGNITPEEINELTAAAYDAGKAETFFLCADMFAFAKDAEESRYPSYLLKKDLLSRFRYFLSYEVWFRYIPIDLGLMLLDRTGIKLPARFEYNRSVDWVGNWGVLLSPIGEKTVLENYKNGKYRIPEINTEHLYDKMTSRIDEYLERFDFKKGEHIFFSPPYSSLFWCNAQNRGYFETYLRAKEYFTRAALKRGAVVYDFQSAQFTTDLNLFIDTTHYLPEINDWMVDRFARREYVVTEENYDLFREELIENTKNFRSEHADLFR